MSATAAQKRHMGRVAELGCIVCSSPAEVHHIRTGYGGGQRAPHELTIPLCLDHHRGDFSIHKSKRQFENIYGSELDLLAQTIARLVK
jgi:hypothetical protein